MSVTAPRLTITFKEEPLQSDLLTYHDWSKAMRTFLKVHRVWQHVDNPKKTAKKLDTDRAVDPAVATMAAVTAAVTTEAASEQEVMAYYLIESNCAAETQRMYLEGLDEDPH